MTRRSQGEGGLSNLGPSAGETPTLLSPTTSDSSSDSDLGDSWKLPPSGRAFIDSLIRNQLLSTEQALGFLRNNVERLETYSSAESLGKAMVKAGLLTNYQLERIMSGTTHGLILGNHRILDRVGAGAMGIVFVAEHLFMKRRVAIKVLPVDDECPPLLLERFSSEMRVLAGLQHPNIVMAFDGGRLAPPYPGPPTLLYLVMELIPGGDLEQYIIDRGPVPVPQGCEWIRQAACGLQAAHDYHLIHRDIKPSNMLLDDSGQVKLVDFGLVRQFSSRLTDPGVLLGTVEYMSPEQSCNPSSVGSQADIYGLGATLFWLLTGEPPYPRGRTLADSLRLLQNTTPRRLRDVRPNTPEELDALVARMLHRDPMRRPALPLTVMNALLPFIGTTASSSDAVRVGA
ncbi:MAG TPA: serine/threonine-protein kinase [Gemmataceae bacterium]|nr:serine/threonine-protein kinase [Gemmataceae bacterium]